MSMRKQLTTDLRLGVGDLIPDDWFEVEDPHNSQLDEVGTYEAYGTTVREPMLLDRYGRIPAWAWELAAYRRDHADTV